MILLDTCALLWLTQDPGKLSPAAQTAIRQHSDELAVSPISLWEIALKHDLGQLKLTQKISLEEWYPAVITSYGLHEFPLDAQTLLTSLRLPPIHKDPCDRMIIATALRHNAHIITADQIIPSYPKVRILW